MKSYYISLDADNRINVLTVNQQSDEQFLFDFPEDFDEGDIINYKIVDGVLVRDEFVYPEIEPQPTLEEQVAELRAENEMLMSCLLEMSEIVYA